MGIDPPKSESHKTIGVQLLGGLGNQMFQAAAGLALAARTGASVIFDLSRFREKGLRAYALKPFGLEVKLRAEPLGALQNIATRVGLRERHRPAWWKGAIHREAGFAYDPAFERLSPDVLLQGYFQSPRYFCEAARLAAQFAPDRLASDHAKSEAAVLVGDRSVAIHIRRGDYANDPRAAAVHPVLPESYYRAAIEFISARVPGASFFVTSDDPAAAKALAETIPGASVLAGKSAGDDLFLMSRCRHHIIANSSFSWWSAWLDRREGGITIAPRQWFTPEAQKTRPTDDLIPKSWVQL
jgi:hypothetical protein